MSHPLSSELSLTGFESNVSPDAGQESPNTPRCVQSGSRPVTSRSAEEWSDSEELMLHMKSQGKERKCCMFHLVYIFTVLSTAATPLLMVLLDEAHFTRGKQYAGTDGGYQVLSGANMVSLGVRFALLCCFLLVTRSGIRYWPMQCLKSRNWRSKSSLARVGQIYTSINLGDSNFIEVPSFSLWIISATDCLTLIITVGHWILFVFQVKVASKLKLSENGFFVPKNPFVSSQTTAEHEEVYGLKTNGTGSALRFVNTQLIVQMTTMFVIKVWFQRNLSSSYSVHVFRSVDGLSRSFFTPVCTVGELAVDIIQSIGLEPVKQPIELGPPKRSFRSKSSDSRRSYRSFTGTANTLVIDTQSQPTSDSSVCTGRRLFNRRRPRSSGNRKSAFKIYALDKPASQQGSPENNEASDVRHLISFSAKDQKTLNRTAVERCHLQSEFDYLVRKRQLRLCLATQRWFDIIGTGDLSKIEKGGKWDNGVRMEQATQVVFDRISGPLMRYLRLINQHHLHTPASIRERLALYMTCNMSATSFLSLYIPNSPPPLIHHPKTRQYFHLSDRSISNLKKRPQGDESLKCRNKKKIKFCFLPKETTGADCNQKANSTLVFETWKFRVLQRSMKYQPDATERHTLNSIIHHGLQFELSRAEVTLLCSVYCAPFLELSTKSPGHSWWSTPIPHAPSVPASTIETCLTGSEHFGEIRL